MKKKNSKLKDRYSLEHLAEKWKIPGGAEAVEMLLLAGGFLTGAYRSKNPHMPYQRYLDLGYFHVVYECPNGDWEPAGFCVTAKGLEHVEIALRYIGAKIPDPRDSFFD